MHKERVKKKTGDTLKFISVSLSFFMVTLICIFLIRAPLYMLLPLLLLFASLGVLLSWLNPKKRPATFKSFFVVLVTLSIIAITYIILHRSGALEGLNNVRAVSNFIKGLGAGGAVVFVLFVILNVVFLPIPFGVVAVIGTIIYGPLLSFLFMSVGMIIGSLLVFSAGRLFGSKIIIWMVGKEKAEKYQNFMNKKGKLAFVFMIVFPFFPDDVLCLLAGSSKMSYKFFCLVVLPIRLSVLAFTCFFADGSIIPFSGWGIPVWIALGALLVGAFIFAIIFQRKIMKRAPRSKKV